MWDLGCGRPGDCWEPEVTHKPSKRIKMEPGTSSVWGTAASWPPPTALMGKRKRSSPTPIETLWMQLDFILEQELHGVAWGRGSHRLPGTPGPLPNRPSWQADSTPAKTDGEG